MIAHGRPRLTVHALIRALFVVIAALQTAGCAIFTDRAAAMGKDAPITAVSDSLKIYSVNDFDPATTPQKLVVVREEPTRVINIYKDRQSYKAHTPLPPIRVCEANEKDWSVALAPHGVQITDHCGTRVEVSAQGPQLFGAEVVSDPDIHGGGRVHANQAQVATIQVRVRGRTTRYPCTGGHCIVEIN